MNSSDDESCGSDDSLSQSEYDLDSKLTHTIVKSIIAGHQPGGVYTDGYEIAMEARHSMISISQIDNYVKRANISMNEAFDAIETLILDTTKYFRALDEKTGVESNIMIALDDGFVKINSAREHMKLIVELRNNQKKKLDKCRSKQSALRDAKIKSSKFLYHETKAVLHESDDCMSSASITGGNLQMCDPCDQVSNKSYSNINNSVTKQSGECTSKESIDSEYHVSNTTYPVMKQSGEYEEVWPNIIQGLGKTKERYPNKYCKTQN